MMKLFIIFVFLSIQIQAEEVYKCVIDGVVKFSQYPCGEKTELVELSPEQFHTNKTKEEKLYSFADVGPPLDSELIYIYCKDKYLKYRNDMFMFNGCMNKQRTALVKLMERPEYKSNNSDYFYCRNRWVTKKDGRPSYQFNLLLHCLDNLPWESQKK